MANDFESGIRWALGSKQRLGAPTAAAVPKIYLSARISPDAHEWNNAVTQLLENDFDVFKPQDNNPCDVPHHQLQPQVYQLDLDAMKDSDLGLLVPPYGRDCAWEVGWYAGNGKPLVVYVESEVEWLRDWMIKGGLTAVITPNRALHEKLCADPIVGNKSRFIETRDELASALMRVLDAEWSALSAEPLVLEALG